MDTSLAFDAIGTTWRIDYANKAGASPTQLRETIKQAIECFDRSFSRFRKDSWVSNVRRTPGTYELPPDAYELLTLYREAYDLSDGKVTPLIGAALEQAGYDADYSFQSRAIADVPSFTESLTFTVTSLTTLTPVLLDFGAAGKGYLIDKIGSLLHTSDIHDFVINAGGDLLHSSSNGAAITIGLENPLDTTEAVGTCTLQNGSLCASAGSRRAWGKYHHILDPETLSSPTGITATWVKAESAAVADIVATMLFFVPPERVRKGFDFSYAILENTMTMSTSKSFDATIFKQAAA